MIDLLGYGASFAVLITFTMHSMKALRCVAILSNILFMLYGYLDTVYPVLVLHAILFPVNIVRLFELRNLQNRLVRVVSLASDPM